MGDFNADTSREADNAVNKEIKIVFARLGVVEVTQHGLSTLWTPSFIPSVGKPSHIDRVAVSIRDKEYSQYKWQWKHSARTRFARHTPMSLTVEQQPNQISSADILYKAISSTAFLGNEPSIQELTRKLVRKALDMGMPWQSIMNTRQCPQNPFDQRNRPSGPDMAVCIPGNQSEQGSLESEMGNISFERNDYVGMVELRIGSWRTIIQIAIEQAESNKSNYVKIPATVIDRAYAFIDMKHNFLSPNNGIIELDVQKAKRLFDLVKSETTAKGVFLDGVGQILHHERFRTIIPKTTPHDGSLWDRDHFTDEKDDLERLYRSSREDLWSSPAPTQIDHQLAALHTYSTEVIKDQDASFPIPDIDIIYQ
eukprot:9951933-Heterocapsa_arctica.AAC.1